MLKKILEKIPKNVSIIKLNLYDSEANVVTIAQDPKALLKLIADKYLNSDITEITVDDGYMSISIEEVI